MYVTLLLVSGHSIAGAHDQAAGEQRLTQQHPTHCQAGVANPAVAKVQ